MKREAGFTLLELLTVVAVIGIMAKIAIPQFAGYKTVAYDKEAQLALRSIATAEAAHFLENATYISCDHSTCASMLEGVPPIAPGVVVTVVAAVDSFSGTARHIKGSGMIFTLSDL